jgi:signal transduction histidine kinase
VAAHLRPSGPPVELAWRGPEDPVVDESYRICLYRFLQEALSNASRHAAGAAVRVEVDAGHGRLTATVSDAGPGFDPTDIGAGTDGGGLGLAGLRDRVESLGGALAIESAPGRGSKLTLSLALANGETR